MGIVELILTAVGLAMDAFAVAVCKGLSTQKLHNKHYLIIGAWFGGFQAAMPAIGYFVGRLFASYIEAVDHWVAFVLLALIGANMIRESLSDEAERTTDSFGVRAMFPMAIATSIDALAVGVAFALIPDFEIGAAVVLIGSITFGLSALGLKLGNVFGMKYKSVAEFAGGAILILMGAKILLEGLNILAL